jgi:anti-sigma factor RsiW
MTTSQDFERLSAYLDHQLSPGERADLEARLAREPELRATLRELRLTVRALRALPPVKPPRSFVLTPAQAGATRGRRAPLFPALRLATAVSFVMFVAVLTADLGGGLALPGGDARLTSDPAAATPVAEVALAGSEAAPTEPAADEAEVFALTTAAAEDAGEDGDQPDAEPTGMVAGMAAPATPTPTVEAVHIVEATAEVSVDTGRGASPTPTPPAVAEAPPAATEDLFYDPGTGAVEQVAEPAPFSSLRVIELGLAMLTVLLGLGAWFARRG